MSSSKTGFQLITVVRIFGFLSHNSPKFSHPPCLSSPDISSLYNVNAIIFKCTPAFHRKLLNLGPSHERLHFLKLALDRWSSIKHKTSKITFEIGRKFRGLCGYTRLLEMISAFGPPDCQTEGISGNGRVGVVWR